MFVDGLAGGQAGGRIPRTWRTDVTSITQHNRNKGSTYSDNKSYYLTDPDLLS